eukprot:TRINITY_DN3995_c0_g4_i1.p1 TRINITY_DN3995_c0_g4~~TRINITY_DN3995_c0_g4_i1.p1  ORF type:complete len:454 (+),score=77.36 TRINITY_DN3995_c0_g4_i1:453-1814(+)
MPESSSGNTPLLFQLHWIRLMHLSSKIMLFQPVMIRHLPLCWQQTLPISKVRFMKTTLCLTVEFLSLIRCAPVLDSTATTIIGNHVTRLWDTVIPYSSGFTASHPVGDNLAPGLATPSGPWETLQRLGCMLGMLMYNEAFSIQPRAATSPASTAFPSCTVPSLVMPSDLESVLAAAPAGVPLAASGDPDKQPLNTDLKFDAIPAKRLKSIVKENRGPLTLKHVQPQQASHRKRTFVFGEGKNNGVLIGIGLLKIAATAGELKTLYAEKLWVQTARNNSLVHVLHAHRTVNAGQNATCQVMPRCDMLDSGVTAVRQLAFFKQLPELLVELQAVKWLVVDVKPSNLGFYNNMLVLVDLDSVVSYWGSDGSVIPKPPVHTPQFSAPECTAAGNNPVTLESDVYAFGKLMETMQAGLSAARLRLIAPILASAILNDPKQRPTMAAFTQSLKAIAQHF